MTEPHTTPRRPKWTLADWLELLRSVAVSAAMLIVVALLALSQRNGEHLSDQVRDLTMDRERTVAEADCIDRYRTHVTIASSAFAAEQGRFIATVLSLTPGDPRNFDVVHSGAALLDAKSNAALIAVDALAAYVNADVRPVPCPLK